MKAHPRTGETWWLNDMLLLVLEHHHLECSVRSLVLLDLDEVFEVGDPIDWRYDEEPCQEYREADRRLT